MDEPKEEREAELMRQALELRTNYGHEMYSIEEEGTKKLNEVVEKGRKNLKEYNMAFKLLRTQEEAKAKELDNRVEFDEGTFEEMKEELIKKCEIIKKKYEDKEKSLAVEYTEIIIKYNRKTGKLHKEISEKIEEVMEKLNCIVGTNLHHNFQITIPGLSYKIDSWEELMK